MNTIQAYPGRLYTTKGTCINRFFRECLAVSGKSAEEQVELCIKAQKGDAEARNQLIQANLLFCVTAAKKYEKIGMCAELTDLVDEAVIGLDKAIARFDPTRGYTFLSYAVGWIQERMMAYISDHGRMVRLPQNKVQMVGKVMRENERRYMRQTAPLTKSEMQGMLGKSVDDMPEAIIAWHGASSLDNTLSAEHDHVTVGEMVASKAFPAPDEPDAEQRKETLLGILKSQLTEEEYTIIVLHFGLDGGAEHDCTDIADTLELSPYHVKNAVKKVLRKLRYSEDLKELIF